MLVVCGHLLVLAGRPEAAADLDTREADAQHNCEPHNYAADVAIDGVTQQVCMGVKK